MSKNHPALLPNGLADILPPYAENENRVINLFMGSFSKFGYQRVKPPLVEFEDSLLGDGIGQSLSRQTFRMMDPVSQRMMGVRADVTAQIARISSSRLADAQRPLRLSYAADVLRVNGTQLRPERQFCQVGCEMIGVDDVVCDVETSLVALLALSSACIEGLTIDLTVPTIIKHIYEDAGESFEDRELLSDFITKRDRDAIVKSNLKSSALIASLMDMNGNVEKAKDGIKSLKLSIAVKKDIDRLLSVADSLRDALDVYGLKNVLVSIDPLEYRGFEYHTGVSFSIFSKGARGELGGGGRYNVLGQGGGVETATGFTLYMDTILRIAPVLKPKDVRRVGRDAKWNVVRDLQDQGHDVVRDVS
jgi:ATP phosphoribosyltransferase regulatory subunit